MAKTKALISFAVTAKLICVFVYAYAKIRFSHDAAHIEPVSYLTTAPGKTSQEHFTSINSVSIVLPVSENLLFLSQWKE